MSKHNKTGAALEKYRAKQRAKKARPGGQKERRLAKRASARVQAIADYEAAVQKLDAAQSAKADVAEARQAMIAAAEDDKAIAQANAALMDAEAKVATAHRDVEALTRAFAHAIAALDAAAARTQKEAA